ncbi:hypothetical protein AAFN47_10860 [Hoeflea sp. CAU 1731]
MKIYDNTGKELMDVSAIRRDGDMLVVKGKIFGAMPMTAKLSPEEARKGLKMLDFSLVLFLLSFLFRSSSKCDKDKK